MNKHVKCGLKVLTSPLALAYCLLAIFLYVPVALIAWVTGCGYDRNAYCADPLDATSFLWFPLYWYQEL